jgi:integrase
VGGIKGLEARAHRRLLTLDLAKLPLSRIDTAAVRQALAPWDGTPTSKKVRTKIKSVIDFAKASGWFIGDNPAAHETMGKLLPAVARARHHEAMPWADVPAFMRAIAAFDTPASRALRFTILTAARSGETLGATWSEIQGDVWAIGERMKEGIPHSVPLTSAAIALLGTPGEPDAPVFGKLHKRCDAHLCQGQRLPGARLPVDVHRLGRRARLFAGAARDGAGWRMLSVTPSSVLTAAAT